METGTKMEIFVYAGDHAIPVVVNSLDPVWNVNEKVSRETGINSKDVNIMSDALHLTAGSLQSNDVRDGTSVFLYRVLNVYMLLPDGKSKMVLVHKDWQVSKLAEVLLHKHGISLVNKHLEYAGQPLKGKKTFEELGIESGATILVEDGVLMAKSSKFLCCF